MELAAAAQPATGLEHWFANEITYAAWELERVRANKSATAAESRLNDAYNRASRNWHRARKELAKLQTARVNHVARLSPSRQEAAAAAPLADPARVPQPRLAGPMLEHAITLVQKGVVSSQALDIVNAQERR
jgi:hypothetical protein